MFTDFRVLTPVSSPCPHIPPPHPQTPFHFLSSLRSIHPGPRMPGVSLTSPYTVVPSDAMPDISLGRDYEHSRTVCSQILPTESQAQDPSRQGSKTVPGTLSAPSSVCLTIGVCLWAFLHPLHSIQGFQVKRTREPPHWGHANYRSNTHNLE